MLLYRIGPGQYLENYGGLGASYQDGARWNSAGIPALYFALSPATALLEIANYLPSPRLVPDNYRLGVFQMSENISLDELAPEELPTDWAQYPYPSSTQIIGDSWLRDCNGVLLLVPSAAVSGGLEKIALFNPVHPDNTKITLIKTITDLFNQRVFSGI